MPYLTQWVDPEEVLTHNGATVYHTYKNDEPEQGTMQYWFTLDAANNEDEREDFDIRELCQQLGDPCTGCENPEVRDHILRRAIDAGLLKQE